MSEFGKCGTLFAVMENLYSVLVCHCLAPTVLFVCFSAGHICLAFCSIIVSLASFRKCVCVCPFADGLFFFGALSCRFVFSRRCTAMSQEWSLKFWAKIVNLPINKPCSCLLQGGKIFSKADTRNVPCPCHFVSWRVHAQLVAHIYAMSRYDFAMDENKTRQLFPSPSFCLSSAKTNFEPEKHGEAMSKFCSPEEGK